MTVFFQHVGDAMAARDIPRTVGLFGAGVKRFGKDEVLQWADELNTGDRDALLQFVRAEELAPFQVWGLPRGARRPFDKMSAQDALMLLDTPGGGGMQYIGRVVFKFEDEYPEISRSLWGEIGFPLILFLRGAMIQYPWSDFIQHVQYAENFDPRGMVYGIKKDRLRAFGMDTDADYVDFVLSKYR